MAEPVDGPEAGRRCGTRLACGDGSTRWRSRAAGVPRRGIAMHRALLSLGSSQYMPRGASRRWRLLRHSARSPISGRAQHDEGERKPYGITRVCVRGRMNRPAGNAPARHHNARRARAQDIRYAHQTLCRRPPLAYVKRRWLGIPRPCRRGGDQGMGQLRLLCLGDHLGRSAASENEPVAVCGTALSLVLQPPVPAATLMLALCRRGDADFQSGAGLRAAGSLNVNRRDFGTTAASYAPVRRQPTSPDSRLLRHYATLVNQTGCTGPHAAIQRRPTTLRCRALGGGHGLRGCQAAGRVGFASAGCGDLSRLRWSDGRSEWAQKPMIGGKPSLFDA